MSSVMDGNEQARTPRAGAAIAHLLRRIYRNEHGTTLIEFAFIAPTLSILLLGLFELGYNHYVNTIMQGAIQKAARDATIEGAGHRLDDIDSKVRDAVHDVMPSAKVSFTRNAYKSYAKVGRPEDYTDTNGDGTCNDGEPFEDANGNHQWDINGVVGVGGARDAVLYVATVSYPRSFGVSSLMGISDTVEISTSTVLRNQPYEQRRTTQPKVGHC